MLESKEIEKLVARLNNDCLDEELVQCTLFLESFCKISIYEDYGEFQDRWFERNKFALFDIFSDNIEQEFRQSKKNNIEFIKDKLEELQTFNKEDYETLEYLKDITEDEKVKDKLDKLLNKIKN